MSLSKSAVFADRLIQFCVDCVLLTETIEKSDFGMQISDQLTRSSSSPALHYGEAMGAQSRKDFIHKMSVCLKELRETQQCLKTYHAYLCRKNRQGNEIEKLIQECNQLVAIFTSSVNTAKSRLEK